MKAFITGIAGFAGSHLAEYLLQQGDQVAGSVRSGDGSTPFEHGQAKSCTPWKWDISEPAPAEVIEQLEEFAPDCIYHLASISVPSVCGKLQPTTRAWSVNVDGVYHVIELAKKLHVQPRVLFVSTSHVYSPIETIGQQVTEDWPTDPQSMYGITKLAAERIVRDTVATTGLDAVIARSFQHAGPGQRTELMLSEWCEQIVNGVSPLRIRNRDSYIDMSDVRDVVRAYRHLAADGVSGEAYNVGSGRVLRSGDIFDQLCKSYAPDRPTIEIAPGLRTNPIADTRRLQALAGWQAEISLSQTLQDTFTYLKCRLSKSEQRKSPSQQ